MRAPNATSNHVTDGSGNMIAGYSYDAFGEVRTESGTLSTAFLFTGEQRDGESGLYYLRARYYDPSTGRFLTTDPFPGFAGDPRSQQPYVYVRNNSINMTDPTGNIWLSDFLGRVLAAGVLIGEKSHVTPTGDSRPNCNGVLEFTTGVTAAFGWAVSGEAGVGVDFCANTGLVFSGGIGGGASVGASWSAIGVTWTNADSLRDRQGAGAKVGMCVVWGVGGCVHFVGQKGVGGVSVSFNVGAEVSFHGLLTGTTIVDEPLDKAGDFVEFISSPFR